MSVQSGSIRFNTDSSKLEIYNGEQWWEIDTTSPYEQTGGTRAVFIGGGSPYAIDFMNISSLGNSATFGTSLSNAGYVAAASSRTRGIGGGDAPPPAASAP